jgi:hemerythrin-like domain-containing protein
MTEIISKLQEDHHHLLEIFDLIDRELQAIRDGHEPNFGLLSHILDYIKYYPDVFHHPLEEFIFDCLWQHPELRPVIEHLRDEHLKLAEMTKAFRDAVTHLEGTDKSGIRNRVITLGSAYIVTQRDHMAAEENTVFPQALSLLTEEEWSRVGEYATVTSPVDDPVFGPSVMARHQELRDRIDQHI